MDLDDTLFSEVDYLLSAYRAIAAEVDRRGALDASIAFDVLNENRGHAAFDQLAKMQQAVTVDEMLQIYRYHTPCISLRPGVAETLDALKSRGTTIGVITDGRRGTQSAKISALGLERWVESRLVIISEAAGGDKLSGIPFLEAERLVTGRKFWYIGDNPAKDFVAANARGWTTVRLTPPAEAIHRVDIDTLSPEFLPRFTIEQITRLPELIDNVEK